MDKEPKEGKKRRKSKVGAINSNFELDDMTEIDKKKDSPFLNNLKDAKPKKDNLLEAILGAKQSASKWKDFANRKRIRKKTSVAGNNLMKTQGTLGLDDIHEDYTEGQHKIFGQEKRKSNMSSASNRALLQYFAKLGHSQKDDELVDLDFVETLVKSGADINCTDKHGQTLLHEVASKWHIDVASFLIEMGADVNKCDNYGRSPLHVAAADDYPAMIMLLIENGADKECKTLGEAQTPVHYAAKNDAVSGLKALIKCNCEYKLVKDYKGRTPLHVAAELDRSETARILLELEAPAGISDKEGQTILTWMITKMPPVALEALEQFHVRDRPNRKQHFYLNLLVHDREKDPEFYMRNSLQAAVKYKQFDLLTHPVFIALINTMWRKFARLRAYGGIVFNLIYIMLWTVYGVTVEVDERHEYKLPEHWWRIVLILAAVGFTLWQIVEEIREYRRLQKVHEKYKENRRREIESDLKYCHPRWPEEEKFLKNELEYVEGSATRYFSDTWNIFDWICYILLIVVIATHIADIVAHSIELARVHIRLTAIVIIFLWLRLMKNVRAFALLGPFVVMLGAMLTDVLKFLFLYLEFYIPFVCAFWMLFGGTKYTEDYDGNVNDTLSVEGFEDFGVALFTLFRMTLVDDYPYDQMVEIDNVMAHLLTVTWLSISAVLCLNLFIALLSDTFQRVYDNAKANAVMQKAQLIINFWDGMDSDSCNKFLDHIHDHCSPKSEYYDDDMTEGGEEDLKKVTIQIKDRRELTMEDPLPTVFGNKRHCEFTYHFECEDGKDKKTSEFFRILCLLPWYFMRQAYGKSTAQLDGFHQHILKYCAKWFGFIPPVYRVRKVLAAIDDNINLNGQNIQRRFIKEELDELMEKWRDQFGDDEETRSALEELRGDDTTKSKDDKSRKMITATKFQSEIQSLREEIRNGMLELQKQQNLMNSKFKQDLKIVKSLLLDLTNGGAGSQGGGGDEGFGKPITLPGYIHPYDAFGQPLDSRGAFPNESGSVLSKSLKKTRKKAMSVHETPENDGSGMAKRTPIVEVQTQDPLVDVFPSARSTQDERQSFA